MENKNLLNTEQVSGSNRTFFMDVKKSVNGKNYLVITQSTKVDEENRERKSIVIFENEIARFGSALSNSLLQFSATGKSSFEDYKSKIQEKYPNAYTRWSEEEEIQLKELFAKGHSADELSINLKRNIGAINSRLKKIGLINPEQMAEA